jgi:ubiquinone/menaquinone biosynthesis C-methylase UbiE
VKFQVADATHLPFGDNSFDVTCVSFALHDMPLTVMEKVLPEMVRITKPGGIIIVVDYGLPKNRFGRFFIYHFVKLYERYYYSNFIKSDLEALLRKSKIEIEAEMLAVCGAVRTLRE